MGCKLFLDSNIVIDMIDESRRLHSEAKKVLVKIVEEEYQVYVSEDMLTTIYYILKGNEKVLHFFKHILKKWHVVHFGAEVLNESIDFSMMHGSDLEDTLQCMCAKRNGCELFLTNDKMFVNCGIDIVTYKAFLDYGKD
jgi:predicted nucleic acid-binding protein